MSPLSAPEYVRSSLADATHRMVCRSPVFPKIPLFGVRAFPHRDQNYREREREREGERERERERERKRERETFTESNK